MPNHIFRISVAPATSEFSGSVKLSDAIDSELKSDSSTASTPYATKQAYDKAVEVEEQLSELSNIYLSTSGGTVDGDVSVKGDLTVEGTINASISGVSNEAIKAQQDADGNVITTTYATKTELNTSLAEVDAEIDGLSDIYATKEELANIDVSSKLHKVATSGSYEDLENKPTIYTSSEIDTKLSEKINTTDILENGLIKSSILPSYVDDIVEVDTYDNLPSTGETGKIYVVTDTNLQYRWSGSTYIAISSSLELGTTDGTAYEGSAGKQLEDTVSSLESSVNTSISNINDTLDQLTAGQVITTVIDITDGTIPVDRSTIFTSTITDDTTFTFETPTTQYSEFWLYLVDAGSYNVEFPDNVKWSYGFEPTLSTSGTDILRFTTLDTGTTWLATHLSSNI